MIFYFQCFLNVPFHCYLVVLFLMRTEQLSYLSLCNGLFFSGLFANFLSLFSFQQFDYYVPRSSFLRFIWLELSFLKNLWPLFI